MKHPVLLLLTFIWSPHFLYPQSSLATSKSITICDPSCDSLPTDWRQISFPTELDYVSFTGLNGLSWEDFRRISDEFTDKVVTGPTEFQEMTESARDALQQQGYFKASVVTHIELSEPDEKPPGVTVNIGLQPGQLFRLKDIKITGARVLRPDIIRKAIPLYPGEIFDVAVIRYGLDQMRQLYGEFGYVNFTPVPDTAIDPTSDTITLIIDVDEGAHYTSDLRVLGLKPEIANEIEQNWNTEMAHGFDKSRGDELLEQYRPQFPVRFRVQPWENLMSIQRDDQQHIAHAVLDLRVSR